MDWLSETNDLLKRDRSYFGFHPEKPCEIRTITIKEEDEGDPSFDLKVITSAKEYVEWTKRCRPSSTGTHRRTLVLAMHRRLDGSNCQSLNAKSLPYEEQSFRSACKNLFQHRSIALAVARKSTAVINFRPATWGPEAPGRSIDTESIPEEDDVVLSMTCFKDEPLRLAVMYGCTEEQILDVTHWLDRQRQSAFHPLILPMVFLELERRRLLNTFELKSTNLQQKVLDLTNRVKSGEKGTTENKEARNQTMTEKDCEAIKLWLDMSSMKNGFESLHEQISSMRDHLEELSTTQSKSGSDEQEVNDKERNDGIYIGSRLKEMTKELRSKVRRCENYLGGMTMVTQMEWNYLSRREAKLNFSIASTQMKDGSQMRYISLMGMVFLPGTFLAVSVFSEDVQWQLIIEESEADVKLDSVLDDFLQLDSVQHSAGSFALDWCVLPADPDLNDIDYLVVEDADEQGTEARRGRPSRKMEERHRLYSIKAPELDDDERTGD